MTASDVVEIPRATLQAALDGDPEAVSVAAAIAAGTVDAAEVARAAEGGRRVGHARVVDELGGRIIDARDGAA